MEKIRINKRDLEKLNIEELLGREDGKEDLTSAVKEIIDQVKKKGDKALFYYSKKFDGADLKSLKVSKEEIDEAYYKADKELISILEEARDNIRAFHEKDMPKSHFENIRPGVKLGKIIRPVERAGVYIPGGKAAYPSSVLMNVIPAQVAGVKSICLMSPPNKEGQVNPYVLMAAKILGIDEIYKIGGAQAIGALAYGTESIDKVDALAGPGNIYVAEAKRQVFGKVAVDMIAGPSEIAILSEEIVSPQIIAADLLSQAEHDEKAQAILITTSEREADLVEEELERQMRGEERERIMRKSIEDKARIFITDSKENSIKLVNKIAPEHMEILYENPESYLDQIKNAGAIFLGPYTTEALGDYFAGPNHTLPTSGTAKFSSGLSAINFMKASNIIEYDEAALNREGDKVIKFAKTEGLYGHARALEVRKK